MFRNIIERLESRTLFDVAAPGFYAYALADGKVEVNAYTDADISTTSRFTIQWAQLGQDFSRANSRSVVADFEGGGSSSDYFGSTIISGLNADKLYQFQVTASDDAGHSATSGGPPLLPIQSPDNVRALPQVDETIRVAWTSNSTHATGYRVRWGPYAEQPHTHSIIVGKNARSATIDGLAEGVDYEFEVTALDGKRETDVAVPASTRRVAPLDRSFTSEGAYYIVYPGPPLTDIHSGSNDVASDVAVQSDGKVIVVGTSRRNFEVIRYNADGSLDTSFGKSGKEAIDFGANDVAHGVTLTPDGGILVVGTSAYSFAMAKLTADGYLDGSFNVDGREVYFIGDSSDGWNIAVDPLDPHRFYLGGFNRPFGGTGPREATVLRFFDSGKVDPDWKTPAILGATGKPTALSVQPDGKVVLAAQKGSSVAVARFNHDGTPDVTLDHDGQVAVQSGSPTMTVNGMTLQRDGKIVLCGSQGTGQSSAFALARLTRTGKLDSTFGKSGIATTAFGNDAAAAARDVTVLQTGEIVAVGTAHGDFAVVRYKPTGALDPNFDRDGMATTDIGSPNDTASALALDRLGTIYVAGTSNGDFTAAHYFVSPVNAPSDLYARIAYAGAGIDLLWTNNAIDQTSVQLQRSEAPDGPWTTINVSRRFDTAYNDWDVVPGRTYYYRVIAVRGSKQSLRDVAEPIVYS